MGWLILLCIFTAFYYYKVRDFFTPGMITCLTWIVVVTAYIFLKHPLYELSALFYPTIFFWCVSFVFGSDLTASKKFCHSKHIYQSIQLRPSSVYRIVFFLAFFSVLMTFFVAKTMNMGVIGLTRNVNLSESLKMPFALRIVLFITTIIFPLFLLVITSRIGFLKKATVFMLFAVLTILSGSKSSVFGILCAALFIMFYRRKIVVWKVLFVIAIALLMVVIITFFRDKNPQTDFLELIYIYFLSPLTAFDYLLQGKIVPNDMPFASTVFGLFYRILQKAGLYSVPKSGLGFIFVPLPTNVYTLLLTGYLDFGYYGMFVFSFAYGLLWGWFYSFAKRGFTFPKLLYATFYYSLVFQFFADFVFPYLVIFIYQAFVLFLPYVRIKSFAFKYRLRTA